VCVKNEADVNKSLATKEKGEVVKKVEIKEGLGAIGYRCWLEQSAALNQRGGSLQVDLRERNCLRREDYKWAPFHK